MKHNRYTWQSGGSIHRKVHLIGSDTDSQIFGQNRTKVLGVIRLFLRKGKVQRAERLQVHCPCVEGTNVLPQRSLLNCFSISHQIHCAVLSDMEIVQAFKCWTQMTASDFKARNVTTTDQNCFMIILLELLQRHEPLTGGIDALAEDD